MADYIQNVRVTATIADAERALDRLGGKLRALDAATRISLPDLTKAANLERTLRNVEQVSKAVSSLQGQFINLGIKGPTKGVTKELVEGFKAAKEAAGEFFDFLRQGKGIDRGNFAKTTAGVQEQIKAFRTLAANIDVASDEFKNYVQAAQAGTDTLLKGTFAKFEALRRLYSENITGKDPNGVGGADLISGSRMGQGFFDKLRKDIPKTTAALQAYKAELERIRDLSGTRDADALAALGVEQEILSVTKQLRDLENDRLRIRAALNQKSANLRNNVEQNIKASRAGRSDSGFADFSQSAGAQTAIDKAVRRQQEKLARQAVTVPSFSPQLALPSGDQLSARLKASGQEVQRLSNYYGDLNTKIDKGVQSGRAFTERLSAAAKSGQQLPPIFGQVGKALETVADTTAKAAGLEREWRDSASSRLRSGKAINAQMAQQLKVQRDLVAAAKEEAFNKERAAAQARLGRTFDKAQSFEAQDRKRAERFGKLNENLALGVGFPLLFGAGPASVIGSAAGSLGGSGFGGQILGGALGQKLDDLAARASLVGDALNNPIKALDLLSSAGIKLGSSIEFQIESLTEAGRLTEAQAVLQKELARTIGTDGVNALGELNDANKRLQTESSKLALIFMSELAPAFTFVANAASSLLNKLLGPDLQRRAANLDPQAFQDAQSKAASKFSQFGIFGDKAGYEKELTRLSEEIITKSQAKLRQNKPTDKQTATELDAQIQNAQKARDLIQQGVDLERSAVDLRLNAEDAVYGLRKRAADIERSSIDLRRSVEDAIFSRRQELARIESDNLRQQAQIGIERLDLKLSQAGRGPVDSKLESSRLVEAARAYLKVRGEGEADLAQKERQLKIELADLDREGTKFRLDVGRRVADLQEQAASYQRDVAKTYLQLTRAAEDHKTKVAKYQYDMAVRTYELAKQTGDIQQIKSAAAGVGGSAAGRYTQGGYGPSGPNAYGPHFDIKRQDGGYFSRTALDKWVEVNGRALSSGLTVSGGQFGASRDGGTRTHNAWDFAFGPGASLGLKNGAKWLSSSTGSYGDNAVFMTPDGQIYRIIHGKFNGQISGATSAPAATTAGALPTAPTAPSVPGLPQAPTLAPIGDLLHNYDAIGLKIKDAKVAGLELAKVWKELGDEKAAVELAKQFDAVLREALNPLREIVEKQKDAAAYQREYGSLLKEGVLPELANQLATINQTYEKSKEVLDTEIVRLETSIAIAKADGATTTELEKQLENLKERMKLLDQYRDAATKGAKKAQSPDQRLKDAYTKVKEELNALTDPVNQIVAGANAIGSAFGTAFKDVASGAKTAQQALSDAFRSIGQHFIDMATQMIAKYIEMKIIGLAMSFLGGAAGGGGGGGGGGYTMPSSTAGGSWLFGSGAPSFMAEGGFVTGPTRAIIGEGGESEYVIPASKMSSAMSRYSAGQRGSSVIAGSGGGGASGGGSGSSTFTLETVVINNVEYATVEQVRAMGEASAKRGAEGGHAKTMGAMRNNRSTRARLGMNR